MLHKRALLAVFLGFLLLPALGVDNAIGAAAGSSKGMTTVVRSARRAALGLVNPRAVFRDTMYSTGGTGLRNQSKGSILLNGNGTPPPAAVAAYAYWAVITNGPAVPGMHDRLFIRKIDPAVTKFVELVGEVVGTGPDPCWPGDTITVFKAPVPLAIINASTVPGGSHAGVFTVAIKCKSASSCLGEDPWAVGLPAPLWEGAAIVAIWPASGRVTSLYDVGISGTLFFGTPGITYDLTLPLPTDGGFVLWDNHGYDGQVGSGRPAIPGVGDEKTTISGIDVAGPGTAYNDSDWNGSDSKPLPQLSDTSGHLLTPESGLAALPVTIVSPTGGASDCLTLGFNLVNQGIPAALRR